MSVIWHALGLFLVEIPAAGLAHQHQHGLFVSDAPVRLPAGTFHGRIPWLSHLLYTMVTSFLWIAASPGTAWLLIPVIPAWTLLAWRHVRTLRIHLSERGITVHRNRRECHFPWDDLIASGMRGQLSLTTWSDPRHSIAITPVCMPVPFPAFVASVKRYRDDPAARMELIEPLRIGDVGDTPTPPWLPRPGRS